MQTGLLFRLAALAWVAAAVARIWLAIVGGGPGGPDIAAPALAIGAALCLAVAALLWLRPTRGAALAATLLGVYAVVGIAYAPFVGLQPWFVALSLTGVIAFVLSVACWRAIRRNRVAGG